MIRFAILLGALTPLLASGDALAQTPKPAAGARAAKPTPPEVVHGFYAEFDFGTLVYLGDAADNVGPGVMGGFAVGADVGRYFRVEGRMLNGTNNSTGKIFKLDGASQELRDTNPCADGDADAACIQTPDVQSSLVLGMVKGIYPVNDRVQFHAAAGGGMLMANPTPEQIFAFDGEVQLTDPTSVEAGSTPVVGGGIGGEYYTRMRHFSVGGDLMVWSGGGGLIVTIYPTIKYTF